MRFSLFSFPTLTPRRNKGVNVPARPPGCPTPAHAFLLPRHSLALQHPCQCRDVLHYTGILNAVVLGGNFFHRCSMMVWSVHCARLLTAAHALGSLGAVVRHLKFPALPPYQLTRFFPLKHRTGTSTQWEYRSNLTGVCFDVLHKIAMSGMTFKDKNALITGVRKGSVGVEILLSGGAHVVATISHYSHATVEYYSTTREFSSLYYVM
jgi:3-oxoacyl-ACP reductase-like protein